MKNALFITLFLGIIIVIVAMAIPQEHDAVTYNVTNNDFKMKLLGLGEVISIFSFGALIAKRFNK